MAKKYRVTDGKLVLDLELAEKGWYAVTSPFDPGLTTQAKSVEDAFSMAYDAQKCLRAARAKLARRSGIASSSRAERGSRESHLVDTQLARPAEAPRSKESMPEEIKRVLVPRANEPSRPRKSRVLMLKKPGDDDEDKS
jgi:antitoxin HicB